MAMNMPIPSHHQQQAVPLVRKKPVLVFSPDPDLARSLSLLLEEEFKIVCVTRLEQLLSKIEADAPTVMIIDLFAFPSDVIRELRVLQTSGRRIPIIVLRIKRLMSIEVEQTIREMAETVLFKPLEGSSVADAIHRVLDVRG
jgi:DNA-binding NtrC family response regulator